jgi:hypothetical protein
VLRFVVPVEADCVPFRLAQRAFWVAEIRALAAADIWRRPRLPLVEADERCAFASPPPSICRASWSLLISLSNC